MTLALLLTAVTGAWAQSTFGVVEFKVPAEWANDNNPVTAADLPGFKAVTLDEAKAWTGAPAEGYAILFYAFDGNKINLVNYANGGVSSDGTADFTKKIVFDNKSNGKFYYTVEPTEWDLTSKDGKNWILAKMPASNVELQVEYEPTKVTMAVNDKTMGTAEVAGESKVEWTAETWKGWTSDIKEHTVDDITITGTQKTSIYELTSEDKYKNSLLFGVVKVWDNSTVTFSTTGDPFSRIEFTMIDDYSESNPNIIPNDNWTVEGKSAVWEGEATKSLTLQSCSTKVSKITFFKGAIPDGVTINTDGTFTVAKTATVTLKATPAEGYKFLYWEDDQTNTNPVREVTIESGMADMSYKAVFAEITYNVTFADGIEEADKWKAEPNAAAKNTEVDIKYNGTKKVLGVKVAKKADNAYLKWNADQKKLVATEMPAEVTAVANSNENVSWQAGTYVVEGEVTITGTITLSGDVNLIIKDGAKLTAQRISGASKNLSIYGQAQMTGELVVNGETNDAISSIKTLEVHSAKVKATSSGNNRGGFFYTETFNVYGGSVDAENTAADGGYGIGLKAGGFMNIFGGEVKAVGKGDNAKSNGINGGDPVDIATVTVYGGKLWAANADDKALKYVNLQKGTGFTGKIEYSSDKSTWSETVDANAKYVRAGY